MSFGSLAPPRSTQAWPTNIHLGIAVRAISPRAVAGAEAAAPPARRWLLLLLLLGPCGALTLRPPCLSLCPVLVEVPRV